MVAQIDKSRLLSDLSFWKSKLTLAVFVLSCHYFSSAQELFFSSLTMKDGLPSNFVFQVAQDKHGFMWMASGNGLVRYDGTNFKVFKKSDEENSLSSNETSTLVAIDDHIWLGTWDGLCKINIETFEVTRVNIGAPRIVRALHAGASNVLWVGTIQGLVRLDLETEEYRIYDRRNSEISHNTVRTIMEDSEENLWVGTYDGLNILRKGSLIFSRVDLNQSVEAKPDNHLILDIRKVPDENALWIGTETGLFKVNSDTKESLLIKPSNQFSNDVIKCIYSDELGNLWLGTDFGLNIFQPVFGSVSSNFHNPNVPYSLANNVIWQIFEDNGGVLWFATSSGLSSFNKRSNFYEFHSVSYKINQQVIGSQLKSFLVSSKGEYWIATQNGVIQMDPKSLAKKNTFHKNASNPLRILSNNVFTLEEDSDGRIWIGSSGGINVWDGENRTMSSIKAEEENGLATNYIGKFTQEPDGTLWVSAWEGGLYKISNPGNVDLSHSQFEAVAALKSDSELHTFGDGFIWTFEDNELFRIDVSTLESSRIEAVQKYSNLMVYSLHFSEAGELWAGTGMGLIEYNPDLDSATFYDIKSTNEIEISSITEDSQGNIWCATSSSLYKFSVNDSSYSPFPLDKNLPINSFYPGCVSKTSEGRIIFGGDNGFISFNPEEALPNTYSPPVYLTSLEINNRKAELQKVSNGRSLLSSDIAFTSAIELSYDQRSIAVQFSSLDFWQPESNIYSYKLEGLDENWYRTTGKRNFAVYSNLPSGEYTFKVKGSNNYGLESNQQASLKLTIHPPLLLSPAFIALYAIVIILGVYYSLKTYSARVHLKNQLKIANLEKEHAEELERTKAKFFTNISHELRTPISLILPPIHQIQKKGRLDELSRNLIGLAERNSLRLLRLVNQVLDFNKMETEVLQLKIESLEMVSFCEEIFSLFTDRAQRHDIDFIFETSVPEQQVWVDSEKIETVLFNLLSNAFKFTPKEGKIEVCLLSEPKSDEFKDGTLNVLIRDNGVGIPDEEQSKIFDRFYQAKDGRKKDSGSGIGLTLAAEYIDLHHGRIDLKSSVGNGTEFCVKLPLGKTHLPIDSIRREEGQIRLLATPSVHGRHKGSKLYQLDLASDKPLILLIDDNREMIEFVRESLKDKYNFIIAEDGQEGIQRANNFSPRVIVSDIMMPRVDGIELCQKIKENPKTSHISIIFVSAKSLTEHKVEGIRVGADAYITKPFEIELLAAQIDNLIRKQNELSEYFRKELIRMPSPPEAANNEDNKFVKRVMDIIEANISNSELTVEMIAQEMAMSSTHLYRKLKATTNHSAKEIIQKYRLKKASLLLQNNEGNITEVMYRVGFSSLSYFSKCFKAEYSVPPKQYQEGFENQMTEI